MQPFVPLQHGRYFHIYNRSINGEDLFRKNDNYQHFLRLYDKYIEPIADTYAWCLMKNHFHLLVRIKEEKEIGVVMKTLTGSDVIETKPLTGFETTVRVGSDNTLSAVVNPDSGSNSKKPKPENQFSHLFNSYAQAYNKMYSRHGGLFETPFKRIEVISEEYFRQLIYYIHYNPVHHKFVDELIEYPWSSYLTTISVKPTKLKREKVIGWFDSKTNFIEFHNKRQELEEIGSYLFE
jgi:putative transposase